MHQMSNMIKTKEASKAKTTGGSYEQKCKTYRHSDVGFSTMGLMADYPDKETTERYITSVPTVSMPGYLNPIIDPTFETTVTRISEFMQRGQCFRRVF